MIIDNRNAEWSGARQVHSISGGSRFPGFLARQPTQTRGNDTKEDLSHAEHAEGRGRRDTRVERRRYRERERRARVARIDHAVVPETRAGVGAAPFQLVLL